MTALRHIAGMADPNLGQICSRCGALLFESDIGPGRRAPTLNNHAGWPIGAEVLVRKNSDGETVALDLVRLDDPRPLGLPCS